MFSTFGDGFSDTKSNEYQVKNGTKIPSPNFAIFGQENQATDGPDASNSVAEEEEEVFHDSVQHEDEDEVMDDLDKMNLENSHCDQEESDIGLETEVAEKEEATETIDDNKMGDGTVGEVATEEQSEVVNDEENKSFWGQELKDSKKNKQNTPLIQDPRKYGLGRLTPTLAGFYWSLG